MTKISSLTALSGSAVDDAADLLPIVDMSEAGAARNKKITIDETRIALGLSSADSPQFTAVNLGHASDTTISRVSAGVAAIEGVNIVTTAGGVTFAADIIVPDEAYDATAWNGSLEVPTKNAVRDKIEALSVGGGVDVEDEGTPEATGATTLNFVGSGVSAADVGGGVVDITIPGATSGVDIEDEGVSEATGALTLNFTGAGVAATDVGGGQVDIAVPGAGWVLAGTSWAATGVWDQAVDGSQAQVTFIGLAGATDIIIMTAGTTKGTTGKERVQVSVDNGSTWFTTSGDYASYDSAGVSTNQTGFVLIDTNATAARSSSGIIRGASISGTPKDMEASSRGSGGRLFRFLASTSPINAVRVNGDGGGNLTGGKIYCLARFK